MLEPHFLQKLRVTLIDDLYDDIELFALIVIFSFLTNPNDAYDEL